MSLYDDLGVKKGASRDEIKKSYRRKAQKEHPDKGGSKETFHAIQKAYAVLGDYSRRAHYDATGEDGRAPSIREEALTVLSSVFMQILNNVDTDHTNVVQEISNFLQGEVRKMLQEIKNHQTGIAKRERALKRLKYVGNGPNIMEQMIQADIDGRKRGLEMGNHKNEVFAEAIRMLGDYSWQASPVTAADMPHLFRGARAWTP